jgi:hypothetical protein
VRQSSCHIPILRSRRGHEIRSLQTTNPRPCSDLYLESLQLVERLHRRLLDVIKDEFDRANRTDINAVQALCCCSTSATPS